MGIEDVFAGISFADAKLSTGGEAPAPGGNAGNPPPAPGQAAASPPAPGTTQEPGKTPDAANQPNKSESTKPLPFDQDPKWKKARATEAAVEKILQEHGILNVEELATKLSKGISLEKLIGTRDAAKLIEDAEYANRVRQNWDEQKRAKQIEGETPEARIARLERENEELRTGHEQFKASVQDKEHAEQVIKSFSTEIDTVLGSLEEAVPESELGLLKLVLGVDNPSNQIDIEDQTAVRKMAREGVANFRTLVQTIKQKAIDDYVSGKSKLAVDTSKAGAPASPGQGVERQPLPKDATVDQVFGAAKSEFTEVLLKGLEAAQ